MLALFTIAHPLVDACSLSVLIAGGMSWQRVIAYNAMAFALQLPMGLVADARPGLVRGGFCLGVALTAGAALAAALGAGGRGLLAAACVGNALFHLMAGKDVLDTHDGHGGPVGLFISTGALGLLAGRIGMEHCASAALPAFAFSLAIVGVMAAMRWRRRTRGSASLPVGADATETSHPAVFELAVLLGLFVLVAWRSWAGLAAGRISAGQGMALLLVGAAVTWCGKALGGYLAGWFGRWRVTAASVCGSAALAFLCPPENVVAWMALLFVAQLATGPVLSLLYDRTGRCGGMAFGLNCLGLFAGSL
jgi:FSR family fosmidomycin resistance protein-like MFS transporter